MTLQPRCGSIAPSCALLCGSVLAQAPPSVHVLGHREKILDQFERLSETDLKATFLRCSREASQRPFGLDEGVLCSSAQDVLKKRSFGSDFSALLVWWRAHRDDAISETSGDGGLSLDDSLANR